MWIDHNLTDGMYQMLRTYQPPGVKDGWFNCFDCKLSISHWLLRETPFLLKSLNISEQLSTVKSDICQLSKITDDNNTSGWQQLFQEISYLILS